MALAIYIYVMHGHGSSNKICPRLQPKKSVLVDNIAAKGIHYTYELYITNKTEIFNLKSGCVVRVLKCLKEDWFIVLW